MSELLIYNNLSGLTFKPVLDYVREKEFELFNKLDDLTSYIKQKHDIQKDIIFVAHGFLKDEPDDLVEACFLPDCLSTIQEIIDKLDCFNNIRSIFFLCCYTSSEEIKFENIKQVVSYKGFIRSDIMPIIVDKYHEIIFKNSDIHKDYDKFISDLNNDIKTGLFKRVVPT